MRHNATNLDSRAIPKSAFVLLLVLVAFALRMYRLDYFSLRGDESFTVLFVQKPFAQMWGEIRTVEPNPPVMYLLLRGWVALAGSGELATRFFSVFWGVLCVPLIYCFARTLTPTTPSPSPFVRGSRRGWRGVGGEGVALTAAFLVTINPYQIWHSQDVRNYTMWPAFSLLALIFFWRWMHQDEGAVRQRSLPTLAAFVLAELAALYTHYYEAFILLALNLYALMFFLRRRAVFASKTASLLQWAGAQAVLALLYLPFPLLLSNRVASYGEGSGEQGVALWDIWQRTFSVFTLGETLDASVRNLAWIPLACALALILVVRWRRERRGVFFLLYAGVPTLAVFVLNLARPLFLERYLNGIAPAYYLLFAHGIGLLFTSPYPSPSPTRGTFGLIRRGEGLAALAILTVLSLLALMTYFYNPAYAKSPDWRGLARAIDAQRRARDVILQNFPETSLVYYDRSGLPIVVYPQNYLPDAETTRALNALNSKHQRVWFIPAAKYYWDPDQYVETWLDRHDDLLSETRVDTFRLELYSTPAQFLKTMKSAGASVDGFATLIGFRLERQGPVWHVVLYWRAQTTTKNNYNVFVHLVAADESQVLSQVERAPVDATFPTDQWRQNELVVDQYDLPISAGAKALAVGMYDPATSMRLAVSDGLGNPRGDAIIIPLTSSP
jgi:4-amino-4-deoxy-L-arabinose transferase-like glycosyltransferase